ncbi:MAG TPA: SUMF1/EgtB/PvdO family nonheme iron enzyme [Polyangiaceae bacterium]|nr:SUMF1/EgtB/PvdO family nonheme iron enzyme [Polyangiaceae bacterium]
MPSAGPSPTPSALAAPRPPAGPPVLLHLPDPDELQPAPIGNGFLPGAPRGSGRCPPEMVDIRGEFCIDRYEISLIDAHSGEPLSPHYHPTRAQTAASFARYRGRERPGTPSVPEPPPFQLQADPAPLARSRAGVIPQGYLSGEVAAAACGAAGKRLCSLSEWLTACRGEQNRKYPYGEQYSEGACNVFREAHPAAVLHGDASREHLDPRLGLVSGEKGPLLRVTGATPSCRSQWGSDAAFDMVGNLDEWVSEGGFVGGFFARATREGCDARVASHPPQYFDYSLGTRCCR